MFEKEKDYYYIEEFRNLKVEAIYGGKTHTRDKITLRSEKNSLVKGYQTHSTNIAIIDDEFEGSEIYFENCDGFITDRKDCVLVTKHADCLAIFFYDKENKVIGICHSGWKGTYEEIGKNLLFLLKEKYNSSLENVLVGIGIGISQKNYEVSEEFYNNFKNRFSQEIVGKSFLKIGNLYYFDNELFNYYLLTSYGIPEKNIILSKKCTFDNDELNSFRRDKEKSERNLAYIFMKG
ncbi:MAG: peptidoglycan editing factor PgeF [Fusobacteriaceae bacterium]